MTEESAISYFLKKFTEKKFPISKNWDLYSKKSGSFNRLVKKVRQLLNIISGENIVGMLSSVLTDKEKVAIQEKYKIALEKLSDLSNKTKQKKKHYYIRPLRLASFSLQEVRNLGYKVSKHLWKTCLNDEIRKNGGGKSIKPELIESIKAHLENISHVSSNRVIFDKTQKNEMIPVRYLNVTLTEAYNTFEFKNQLSFQTFYSYIGNEYKKPHRLSDLCDYCEHGLDLKKDILKFCENYGYKNYSDKDNSIDLQPDQVLKYLKGLEKTDEIKMIINKVREFMEIKTHKDIAMKQRDCYNKMKNDKELLENSIIIEFDFKQKIVIGISPRQRNSEFYSQEERILIGFGIYFLNEEKEIDCINFDIVSNLTQDASTVIKCLEFIRSQEFFKKIEKNTYIVWCDTGMHFRCAKMLEYFFGYFKEKGIKVDLNFFCEKHGKNSRDQHFSIISNYLEQESLVKKLTSSKDIVDAINKRQEASNEKRVLAGKRPIIVIAAELQESVESVNIPQYSIRVSNIDSYYNFKTTNENFELVTSIFSYQQNNFPVFFKENKNFCVNEKKITEKYIPNESANTNHLRKKRKTMHKMAEYNKFKLDLYQSSSDEEVLSEPKKINIENSSIPNECKIECVNCQETCSMNITDLLNDKGSQKNINLELKKHKHPMSRVIDGKGRITKQARQELINHYIFSHLN